MEFRAQNIIELEEYFDMIESRCPTLPKCRRLEYSGTDVVLYSIEWSVIII